MSANDPDDFIKLETEWIGVALRECKPFLGICLGAQMLAKHLGARVYEHPEKRVEIGYYPIRPTPHSLRFGKWPERVYHWHQEASIYPRRGAGDRKWQLRKPSSTVKRQSAFSSTPRSPTPW